jgi:ketosteroid isomerase-like protein
MPQGNTKAVRTPLKKRHRSRRTLDQRLVLRFPRLGNASFRLITRLPPTSRVRRAALARAAELALEAFNRRDLAGVLLNTHPDFEYHAERTWVEAGLVEPSYRGLEGYRRYITTVDEVWAGENTLTPVEVIDLGAQFVMIADAEMRAQASGVPLSQEYAAVVTLQDGMVFRLQEYFDHGAALTAVGLPDA